MKVIKPESKDQEIKGVSVFLAGTIENGNSEDWQKKVEFLLSGLDITILNPRRDDWDSSWVQEQKNPQFNYQVNWEMNMLQIADVILMNFCSGSISPISLLELGTYGDSEKMIVCCPAGYAKKGNVDVWCSRKNVQVFENLEDALGAVRTKIALHF